MLKTLAKVCCLGAIVAVAGCADIENEIAANGGGFGPRRGAYVVVNYSGEKIQDVWVLPDAYCQSVTESDGWLFLDVAGNAIHLGGDVKVIRLKSAADLAKWHEYHAEWSTQTYQETFGGK